jgi:hypothetical protein
MISFTCRADHGGSFSVSRGMKWSDEVLKVLEIMIPKQGWAFEDAKDRLRILCVDKRRNHRQSRRLLRTETAAIKNSGQDVTRFSTFIT